MTRSEPHATPVPAERPTKPTRSRAPTNRRNSTTAAIIRRARQLTGLSQAELAERMGTHQSTISAYECGARVATVATLERIIDATGLRLEWTLTHGGSGGGPLAALSGPRGQLVRESREEILDILEGFGLGRARVIGPVASGQEEPGAKIMLVVDIVAPHALGAARLMSASGAVTLGIGAGAVVWTEDDARRFGWSDVDVSQAVLLETE